MAPINSFDLAILIGYLIAVVSIGLYFARRERTSEDFFLAGRKLGWPIIGLSLFASNIGTEHLVGLAGEGHRVGLVVGGFEWIACLCLIVLGIVFVPQYIRTRIYTIPEFVERRFSLAARMYLSTYFMVMIVLTKVSIALYAGAVVVETICGWSGTEVFAGLSYTTWVILGIGILTGLYTALGGLGAVVYTDALQTVILVLGSLLLLFFGFQRVGGWSELSQSAPDGFLSMVKPVTHPEYPVTGFFFGNLFGGIFYWCMDQSIVQRALGARDVEQGQKGAIFGGFLKILPVFLFVLPGVLAVVLFPDIKNDAAFPTLVNELLPIGIRGLVLAGLLAALMSSLDSALNASATLVTRDYVVRFSRTEPSQLTQIWIGRATIAVIVISGVLWAPKIGQLNDTLWIYLQTVSAYMGMPVAAAVLTGILWKRATNPGALSAMVVGTALGLVMFADSLYKDEGGLVDFLQTPVMTSFLHRSLLAFLISVMVMVIVSLMTSPPPSEKVQGVCFEWRRIEPTESPPLVRDHRTWVGLLLVLVAICWIVFR